MAPRIEIIPASNSDGPAPLSACRSAAIAPVATSISPATMIPLNIVHPVMEAGAPPASGLQFRTKQKAQARCRLGRKGTAPITVIRRLTCWIAWRERAIPVRETLRTEERRVGQEGVVTDR